MNKARDIRLIAIGLVIGMVLGYFIAVEQPPPPRTGVTMAAWPAPRITNAVASPEIRMEWYRSGGLVIPEAPTMEKWGQPLIDRTEAPDFPQRRRGVPPARHIGDEVVPGEWGASPGTRVPNVPVYDSIDFKYVPDFKLP